MSEAAFQRACAAVVACAALIALSVAPAVGAEIVFRCTGADGVPVYSDHACGPHPTRIEVPAPAPHATAPTPAPSANAGGGVHLDLHNSNVVNAPAGRAAPAENGGGSLPFSKFRRLEDGMSEGKVLAIAGPPARETVDAINTFEGIQRKSYYYVNHGYSASITHIQFVNGRVVRIDRTPLLGN